MIRLTDEMRLRLSRALDDGFPVVAASVEPDGYPKVSVYGSCHVHSDDQLALWHRKPGVGLLARLEHNPRVALFYLHHTDRAYWQFFGRARVVADAEKRVAIYDSIPDKEKFYDHARNGDAIVVDLDRVIGFGLDMRRE